MPTTLQAKERKKQRKSITMAEMDKAYDAAYSNPPRFTMRPRLSHQSHPKPTSQETAGPVPMPPRHKDAPKWTMRARTTKMLQLPGMTMDAVPGPGTYPVPSSIGHEHPSIKKNGNMKFAQAPRFPVEPDSD